MTPRSPYADGRPRILTELRERLQAYLDQPNRHLPTLNAANGSVRQQRVERRIACVQMLRAMLKYLDLASLRIGIPLHEGRFMSLTVPFLAKHAGLSLRRAERAMRDLLRAGLITSQQRVEHGPDGGYRGLPALRQMPPALFAAFGLAKWLRHERGKAVLRRYRAAARRAKLRRQQATDSRAAARSALPLAVVAQGFKRASKATERHDPRQDHGEAVARRVGLLKLRHPEWDRERCYQVAYDEIGQGEQLW